MKHNKVFAIFIGFVLSCSISAVAENNQTNAGQGVYQPVKVAKVPNDGNPHKVTVDNNPSICQMITNTGSNAVAVPNHSAAEFNDFICAVNGGSSCSSGEKQETPLSQFLSVTSCSCGSQTMTWTVGGTSCSGMASANYGGSVTLSTTNPNGSATYSCSNSGVWSGPTNASCVNTNCPAGPLNWTVNGTSCSGNVVATASGSSANATSASPPGSATFTCNAGTWSNASNPICPGPCPVESTVTWQVGANNCSGNLPATTSGSSAIATTAASSTNLGSASYDCNSGVWSTPYNISCQGCRLDLISVSVTCITNNRTQGGGQVMSLIHYSCSAPNCSDADLQTAYPKCGTGGGSGNICLDCTYMYNALTGTKSGSTCTGIYSSE